MVEPYVGQIITEKYQLQAKAQRQALFDGIKAVVEAPSRVAYVEETMRALAAGELTTRSRSVEVERGIKSLEKRLESLQGLLIASTLLNLALGATAGPLASGPVRKLAFLAAGVLGLKALQK
jgi:hypothetical protein